MGVCCIVFDIDGMLFEFFMILFFQYFMFSLHFMLFPTFKNKYFGVKKKNSGGGGGSNFVFIFVFHF